LDSFLEIKSVNGDQLPKMICQIEMTERLLKTSPGYERRTALPRLVRLTLEEGSWIDTEEVRGMWAGLLASLCTEDGKDESNLIFVNLLAQLTSSEARLLNYLCENAEKVTNPIGVVSAYTSRFQKPLAQFAAHQKWTETGAHQSCSFLRCRVWRGFA